MYKMVFEYVYFDKMSHLKLKTITSLKLLKFTEEGKGVINKGDFWLPLQNRIDAFTVKGSPFYQINDLKVDEINISQNFHINLMHFNVVVVLDFVVYKDQWPQKLIVNNLLMCSYILI